MIRPIKIYILALFICLGGAVCSTPVMGQCPSGFEVKLGYELDLVNKKLRVFLVSNRNISGPLCNFFSNGSQVAVRWPEVGVGVNPVTNIAFTAGVNTWVQDPLAGNSAVGDAGGDGYYYALFNTTNSTSQNLALSPNLELFSIDYTSTSDPAFEFVAAGTTVPNFSGTFGIDPAMLFGFADRLNGFIAPGAFPVEWTHFDAKPISSKSVELSWGTAMELNNDHFDIEKSVDGVSFNSIGQVKGNGTTTEAHSYTFQDDAYVADKVYYRLRQVDINGGFDFSDVREVRLDQSGYTSLAFEVSPNPATTEVSFKLLGRSEEVFSLLVIDTFGKQVLKETFDLTQSTYKMKVDHLAEGMYYASLLATDGSQYSIGKFLKK